MIEYIIFILIACLSAYILYVNIKKKLKGEEGCGGCSCDNCPSKCSLVLKEENKDPKDK